jgi:hypothetical protein
VRDARISVVALDEGIGADESMSAAVRRLA